MVSASHSDVLWSRIGLAEERLFAASDLFWNHPGLALFFPTFLIQLHRIVRGGLELMAFASTRSVELPDDPVAEIAAQYLANHILEERDHAGWLVDDLATLGIEESSVLLATPLPSVVKLLAEQHLWIDTVHPVSIFGYLLVLEGRPPLIEQLDLIQHRTGLPATAFRCLRSHAEDDPAHLADLNRTLDAMPLTPQLRQRIALSAFHTIDTVASLLEEILAGHPHPASSANLQPSLISASHA